MKSKKILDSVPPEEAEEGIVGWQLGTRLKNRQVLAAIELKKKRFAVMICHRRWGKTVLATHRLVLAAVKGGPSYRGAYIAPTYRQGKDVAWDYLKALGIGAGAKINESELRMDFSNGARIKVYGAENPDSLRGLNLCDVVFDEVAQMPWSVWAEIVLPMIVSTKGRVLFIGTPKGKNSLQKIWEQAKVDRDWVALMFRASESSVFNEHELQLAKKSMSEDEYEQEYECSFLASIKGSYYGKMLEQAEKDGRICGVPYDPTIPVWTAWDLGFSDSTAIWFAQIVGREVHVIDYYESTGRGLDHYADVVRSKGYLYSGAGHLYPHDVAQSELGTGTTRLETLRQMGLPGRVLPMCKVDDGINAVRVMLPRCWFDERKCAKGLDALRMYQRQWDEKTQDFRSQPRHDWASHGADSFRYLAQGIGAEASGIRSARFKPIAQRLNLRVV